MRLQIALLFAALIACSCGRAGEPRVVRRDGDEAVVQVSTGDREMELAIQEARRKLPEFLKELRAWHARFEIVRNEKAEEPNKTTVFVFEEEGKKASTKGSDIRFAVKAPFKNDIGEVEHMWIGDVIEDYGHFIGYLDSDPLAIQAMHRGDWVDVLEGEITDWAIWQGGKIIKGGFTVEVLERREANAK